MVKENESVWNYPRPPILESAGRRVRVIFNDIVIADSARALRILETSHPPTYYVPPGDVRMESLSKSRTTTYCEFKGSASYWTLRADGRQSRDAAWSYSSPRPGYEALKDYLCFYCSRVDRCFLDEEEVRPQSGDFYGGWITDDIVGPFKGGPGTQGW